MASHSSFAFHLALLSTRLRRLYYLDFGSFPPVHWLVSAGMPCDAWEGVTAIRYRVTLESGVPPPKPGRRQRGKWWVPKGFLDSAPELRRYLTTLPTEKVVATVACAPRSAAQAGSWARAEVTTVASAESGASPETHSPEVATVASAESGKSSETQSAEVATTASAESGETPETPSAEVAAVASASAGDGPGYSSLAQAPAAPAQVPASTAPAPAASAPAAPAPPAEDATAGTEVVCGRANTVTMSGWFARFGNWMSQLGHAFQFATVAGACKVNVAGYMGNQGYKGLMHDLLDLPKTGVDLWDGSSGRRRGELSPPPGCPEGNPKVPWFFQHCNDVPAREYHRVMQRFVWPMLSSKLSACVEAPLKAGSDALLTIHLRGDDIWNNPKHRHAAWQQPPCAMYERIIADFKFTRILVVTSPDRLNPCLGWLQEFANRTSLPMSVQTSSLLEDVCTLLRASNLVLSHSSFLQSLALLSKVVQRIFWRDFSDFRADHWLMSWDTGCDPWEGVTGVKYLVPVDGTSRVKWRPSQGYRDTFDDVKRWVQAYPAASVRQAPCKGDRGGG